MNLGIYISSLSNHDELSGISNTINNYIGNKLTDASVFYDNIAPNPFNIKCGLFNSTDLWNFNGKLITTSLSTTIKSLNIVNNIDIYYYYGWEKKISPLSLFHILSKNIKIISKTKKDDDDLYRKTAVKSLIICNDFSDIVENIG
jgi:hypothetical protein